MPHRKLKPPHLGPLIVCHVKATNSYKFLASSQSQAEFFSHQSHRLLLHLANIGRLLLTLLDSTQHLGLDIMHTTK